MKRPHIVGLLFLWVLCPALQAQTFDLDKDRQPIASLGGLWRFHTGDDPSWSDPGFDDSQWPLLRSQESWSTQGYKGYGGTAWYRFRVVIPAGMGSISLMPAEIRTNYQVFSDGRLVGECGGMPPHPVVSAGPCQSNVFALSTPSTANPRTLSLAIRVWHWPLYGAYRSGVRKEQL
jgi:sigma-B regulation protein RsbU (phosphoserine phosphatase)